MLFEHNPIVVLSIHLIGALIAIFFVVLALFHDSKSATNRALAFLMLTIVIWIGNNYFLFASTSVALIISLVRLQMILATMQIFGNLAFIYYFPKEKIVPERWHIVLFSILGGLALVISPFLFKFDVSNLFHGTVIPHSVPSPLNPLWGMITGFVILLTAFLAFKKYRSATQDKKSPYLAILTGTVGTFILLMITQFLLLNVLGIIDFNFYGPVFLMPLVFGAGYAIIKHHLFNIKAIATEMIIFSLWLFLLVRVFFEKSPQDAILDIVILFGVVIIGIFLIRSVLNEVKQKEKLAQLNAQLDNTNAKLNDLNQNLEQKVAEQTIEIRKSYEVEKKARIELEELDKAKDQFILTTQHHLRTPLTIVKGYLQSLITKKSQSLDDESKNYLTKASDATDRVSNLVNEFLDISQMEVGKSILNKQLTDILQLVSGIIEELSDEIHKKNLTVKIDIHNDILIDIDTVKFKEAVTNIIDNAVRYNVDNGSIIIKGENTNHPIERDKKIFKLTVESTGIGLTQEELSSIFTQYFQRGKIAEKLYTTGRGIGLTITKNIIQAHGGRIYAESKGRDKGARFVVEMPV